MYWSSVSNFAWTGINGGFCSAAAAAIGALACLSVLFQGGIFAVVEIPIDWNATNALYEFFVVFLFLNLGRGF